MKPLRILKTMLLLPVLILYLVACLAAEIWERLRGR